MHSRNTSCCTGLLQLAVVQDCYTSKNILIHESLYSQSSVTDGFDFLHVNSQCFSFVCAHIHCIPFVLTVLQIFHKDCFTCSVCQHWLEPGEEAAIKRDGLYCRKHTPDDATGGSGESAAHVVVLSHCLSMLASTHMWCCLCMCMCLHVSCFMNGGVCAHACVCVSMCVHVPVCFMSGVYVCVQAQGVIVGDG